MTRVLLLDNVDSFVFNVAQALAGLGADVVVHRNDALTVGEAVGLGASHVVISPGPGRPESAGITVGLVRACLEAGTPLLGVCLGHQALVQALGGRVVPAARLVHGQADHLVHDGRGLFAAQPQGLEVGRYHSLAVEDATLPPCLEVSARSGDGEVMAVRHRTLPAVGVQFHPESVLTPDGDALFARFLTMSAGMPAATSGSGRVAS